MDSSLYHITQISFHLLTLTVLIIIYQMNRLHLASSSPSSLPPLPAPRRETPWQTLIKIIKNYWRTYA